MKKNPMIRFKDVKRHKKIKLNGLVALSFIFAIVCFGLYSADFSHLQISDAAGVAMAALPVFIVGGAFKELEGEDLVKFKEEATPEQLGEYYESLNKHNRNKLEELIKANASKEDVNKLLEALKNTSGEDVSKFKDELVRVAAELKALKEVGATPNKASLKDEFNANKEVLKKIANKVSSDEVTIKALTLRSFIANNKTAYDLPEIGQLATRKLSLYDINISYF